MLNPDDEFLTVAEIAAHLRLNHQTVRNWLDAGRMPHYRIGRRVRVRRTDFEAFLADAGRDRSEQADESQIQTIWDGEIPDPIVETPRARPPQSDE
jgi:excisionase family DNA binding protein